jgi:hypothetical protein
MYNKIPGGSTFEVQGLTCNLPPVGKVFNKFTNKLENRPVFKRSEIKEEQYWEIPTKPDDISRKLILEERTRQEIPTFFDPELQSYREREWDRRINGFWFYNNGKPTYITGLHYFYLAHWVIDIGYPSFRIPDLKWFYFWDYCVEDPDSFGMTEVTQRRQGKCNSAEDLIRMYNGDVKKAVDVKKGDLLMGPDSKPRLVLDTFGGFEELYDIIPHKGHGYSCNGDHLLRLFYNGSSQSLKRGWKPKTHVDIPAKDYNSLTASEKDHLVQQRTEWGNEYAEQEHIIPPYLLGVYIGDGSRNTGHITSPEPEIIEYLEEYAPTLGCRLTHSKLARKISIPFGTNYKNPFREKLRKLNILEVKHIPREYIIDSRENRLQLMAGLMDTDGHLVKAYKKGAFCGYKGYEIIQKEKVLADAIVELSRSLGFYTSISEKIATLKREGKETYKCLVYRISIYGKTQEIPCKVERKKIYNSNSRQSSLNTGIRVEKGKFREYSGFTIDGDNLYLLADGTIMNNSFRAGEMIYEVTSRSKRKRSGIQSKDKEAAETFFDVHVVQPFTELEKIFKPTIDLDKGIAPKTTLRFFKTSTKGAVGARKQEDDFQKELRSRIDFQSSKNKAYDGKKLLRYVRDESGKVEEAGANVYISHGIIKPCLTDGDEIIGKALYTTTVEDMKDDDLYDTDGNFRRLWDESDQNQRGGNNRTKSGLYRYFMAAYECMYFDKYGYADEVKARRFHDSERANLTGQALSDYIRRYPYTADEAFWTSREGGIFNPIPIRDQLIELGTVNPDDLYIIGNLHWQNNKIGTKVIFTETPTGKFKFHRKFDIRAECEKENSVRNHFGKWIPNMKASRIIGVDPVDHKLTEQAGSKASAHLYIKFNLSSELSETFVCEYLNRPEDPEIFYRDMGLLAFATGAELMVENQKPGLINYCNRINFEHFIISFGTTQGIPASPKNQRLLADVYEIYIEHNIKKIIYPNILSDLSIFNLIKTTKFDAAMSSGWALVGSYDERIDGVYQTEVQKPKIYDANMFF